MKLGLVSLRQAASFRNQSDLIHKAAVRNGWEVSNMTMREACVGPPKRRYDKLIALIPLWPRYVFDILRLTALASSTHVVYGPVDGPFQLNVNFFKILRNLKLVAPSQFCVDCIEKSANVKCSLVYHGIDHKDFVFPRERIEGQRERWISKHDQRTILFANLNPIRRKGFPHLCKAINILTESIGSEFLVVLHTGLKEAEKIYPNLRKTPNLLVESAYNVLPFRAMALKTKAADIYVHPALLEGFGLPLLEAMAAGRAIVSLNAPAMNELVSEENGWVFPFTHIVQEKWNNGSIAQLHEYKPQALADAMENAIINKAESKKKGQLAFKKSKSYDYMKVYTKLLKM